VVEGLVQGLAAGHVVAFPELGEVRAFEEEFADVVGEVGGVGRGACDGAQLGDAGPDLVVPVGEQAAGGGVEEEVAGQVGL
jgi:hypothetical protein